MDEHDLKRAGLRRSLLFGGLSDGTLTRLADLSEWRSYAGGASVFRKGDSGAHLFVIVEGRVRIGSGAPDGRELVFNLLAPGAVFGELAFADGGARTAEAVAVEPTRLLTIDRRDLLPFLREEPEVLLKILALLAERARWISDNFEDNAFMRLPARLAKRLLMLSQHFGVDGGQGRRLAVRLRHHELASHMNVTRESITRLLQIWRVEGLIDEQRGVITLKDLHRLEALSHAD
jgi:CRP-like cAMP-binding protein